MSPPPVPAVTSSRRRVGLGWAVILVLGLIVGLVLASVTSWDNPFDALTGSGEYVDQGPVVVQAVRTMSELSTVEVVESTTIEAGEDNGILDFATGDRIFLFAVASISAGVDLGEVGPGDVEINDESGAITLVLPAPSITSVEMDNQQTRVYDRDTGLFTSGDPQLEGRARLAAEEELVAAALQDGILDRARASTEVAMRAFLTSLGYERVTISFRPQD